MTSQTLRSFALRLFSLILVSASQPLPAQNLVLNGSFEDYITCPGSYSRNPSEFRVNSWRALTLGSPDYFNTCNEGDAGVPYNWAGVSDAADGYGYVGIYTYMHQPKEYREYLHTKLVEGLIKDSLYQIEFRYKLSSYSKYATDRIGVLLSDSLAVARHDRPLNIGPGVLIMKDSALTLETGSWEVARAQYRAKGNERFLTIGNFASNEETRTYYIRFRPVAEPMLEHSAYYYIDGVVVKPMFGPDTQTETFPVFTGDDAELNTIYVLRNIQFEFNSYRLRPESFYDLERVVEYLKKNSSLSVELAGHTDSEGDDAYNRDLSARRAESAAAYLIANGIDQSRIATVGYGEERPVTSGDTPEAGEANRRVEITFFR